MSLIYAIVVYGMLHNVEMVLPQTYPDLASCQAALVQTHLTFGNWGSCEPLAARVEPMPKGRFRSFDPDRAYNGGDW